MPKSLNPQPDFENPPVSEVAISVSFIPLEKWRAPHAGLYWGRVANSYPKTEVHPPVPAIREKFGADYWISPKNVQLQVLGEGADVTRTWFLSEDESRLIQLQRDRFIVNWRRREGAPLYPKYHDTIRPLFEQEWANFRSFVKEKELGDIDVQQCEVIYVNDIEQGHGWESFADFGAVFAPWKDLPADGFLPALETFRCDGSFEMPDQLGRLRFHTQHLRRSTDEMEVLQIQMIARGRPSSSTDADVLGWIDIGHDWIVNGFIELTTQEAQRIWGRKS